MLKNRKFLISNTWKSSKSAFSRNSRILFGRNHTCKYSGVSLRIEVAGGYYKMTGESGHSEKKLTSSFYRLMKFSRKIPCSSRRILRSPMLNEHPEIHVQIESALQDGNKLIIFFIPESNLFSEESNYKYTIPLSQELLSQRENRERLTTQTVESFSNLADSSPNPASIPCSCRKSSWQLPTCYRDL